MIWLPNVWTIAKLGAGKGAQAELLLHFCEHIQQNKNQKIPKIYLESKNLILLWVAFTTQDNMLLRSSRWCTAQNSACSDVCRV